MHRFLPRLIVTAVASVLTAGLAQAAWAQDAESSKDAASATATRFRPASESPVYKEHKLDIEAARNPLSRRLLAILSAENLEALVAGADWASVITTTGRSVKDEFETNSIGDFNKDLVYTPLPPCRVIDTRNAVGDFSPGEIRNYDLIGPTNYSSLGGFAGDCGIPVGGGVFLSGFNTVQALVVNVTAASGTGLGNFKAWPTNKTEPSASIINFGTTQNIANGLVLPTCDESCFLLGCPPCQTGDLTFKANASSVHLVVDVIGYMSAANVGFASAADVAALSNITTACTEIGSTVYINNGSAKTIICQAYVNVNMDHTSGNTDEVTISLSETTATCGSTGPGSARAEIDSSAATTSGGVNLNLSVTQTFSLAANGFAGYFLNATGSTGNTDDIFGGKIVCIAAP